MSERLVSASILGGIFSPFYYSHLRYCFFTPRVSFFPLRAVVVLSAPGPIDSLLSTRSWEFSVEGKWTGCHLAYHYTEPLLPRPSLLNIPIPIPTLVLGKTAPATATLAQRTPCKEQFLLLSATQGI